MSQSVNTPDNTVKPINARKQANKLKGIMENTSSAVSDNRPWGSGFVSLPSAWPSRQEFHQYVEKSNRRVYPPCMLRQACFRSKVKDGEIVPGCKCQPKKNKPCAFFLKSELYQGKGQSDARQS